MSDDADLATAAVMRKLVAIRKGQGLTCAQVTERMFTTTNGVENFEWRTTTAGKDIRLSTLIRYMRAIGVQLAVEFPAEPGGTP